MILSINVNSSNSSTNLQHFHPSKPMAISSITSPTLPNETLPRGCTSSETTNSSSTSSPSIAHEPRVPSPASSGKKSLSPTYPASSPSSPDSPDFFRKHPMHHFHSRGHHPYAYNQQSYPYQASVDYSHYTTEASHSNTRPTRSSSISSVASAHGSSPLSLQERRQRNKAASAKYRAKKNQQHGEMRTLISSLTKENDLLQRQLDHVRRDNHRLKITCDRIRGKMLAEKMLKKLLNTDQQQEVFHEDDAEEEDEEEDDHDDDDDDTMMMTSNCNSNRRISPEKGRYFENHWLQTQSSIKFDQDVELNEQQLNGPGRPWDPNHQRQQSKNK